MSWNARRILREVADPERRQRILRAFWRYADPPAKVMATAQLARSLHFRDETIRRMPADKKAELLASRLGSSEFEPTFEAALVQYHTHEANEMMAAFLDRWHVPHVKGSIEGDDYKEPDAAAVREAVDALSSQYDHRDIAIYLASAGALMGWEGVWAVVEEMGTG
ncbi:MAG TPA: hypothetical protein VKH35_02540 [Thermoanaerobaculia bacterium]|nr:hypothetical protein [Thermoanaerobaculia bacterium]